MMHKVRYVILLVLVCFFVGITGDRDPAHAASDVILRAADAAVIRGTWSVVADATAAGGSRVANPDAGAGKLTVPLASPANYFELTFSAQVSTAYRFWIRGKAQGSSYENDSVYAQFSDSVTSSGAAVWRVGSTSGGTIMIEDCTSCGVSGWGWQDNGFGAGVLGTPVYFAASGTHTVRIQVREDGLSIDQLVLSPITYFDNAPGALKNDNTILAGGGSPPPPISLVRGPYLQQVQDRSAIIVWASREPGPATARIDEQTVTAATTFFPASSTGLSFDYYQHDAAVTGLSPATVYAYDLFVGGTPATAGTDQLKTAPPTGTGSISFIIFGDSGTGSTEERALAALMNSDSFDFSLHGGDIAYGNTGGTGDASYTSFQAWFFDIYKVWLRRKPFFPSMGNHDSRPTTTWGRAYMDLFVLPEDAGAGPYPDHAEHYYSFDYGPAHLIALDTELPFTSPARLAAETAWLENDLISAAAQPWKIAFYHRSPYASGTGHGSALDVRQAFGPLFEKYGVQLSLSAHEHSYERSVPLRTGTAGVHQAVTYMVNGGGGGPLYPIGQDVWTAISALRHHYEKITINGCVATLSAIDTTGAIFDTHSLDRCAQSSDTTAPAVSFVSPSAGATVSGPVSVTATASDDVQVEKVDLFVDGQLEAIDTTAPYAFIWATAGVATGSHTLQLRAYDIDGKQSTRTETVTVGSASSTGDIVLHAVDVPAGSKIGDWSFVSDAMAADGLGLWNPNHGIKYTASATPAHYFETTFNAEAGVAYHLWVRMKAEGNSYANDSLSVQFNGAVTVSGIAQFRIGTASAASVILEEGSGAGVHNWGWNDNGYGTLAANIYFATSGPQTLRAQAREDGVSVDQIVLSPSNYLSRPPGGFKDDATVVAK
jgi:hypothetical protein